MRICVGFALALGLLACSSGLKYTVDDNAIANVAVSDRKAALDAQNEINQAKAESQKADSDLQRCEGERSMADKDYSSAKINADKAADGQKLAEQSHDINQMNRANREKEVAQAGISAAEAKQTWLNKRRKALKLAKDAADKHLLASQAKYELEKARIAQQKGIKPSTDFDVQRFDAQYQEAQKEFESSKRDADAHESDGKDAERDYQNADKRYREMASGS
jgi:hypothetical protein